MTNDPTLASLRVVHELVIGAGRAHTGGDQKQVLQLLVEAKIELVDLVADLQRATEDEPS